MARLHFLTFGDGSPQLRGAGIRLQKEALRTKVFATAEFYHLRRIRDEYPLFWEQHRNFLLTAKRGLGYFLWKPFLVATKLMEISENDFLIYADAGCEIIPEMTQDLVDLLPTEPTMDLSAVPLEPFHTTARWTNNCCLRHLDNSYELLDRPQIGATFMFLRNTNASRGFTARWLEWCIFDDYCCIIDRPGEVESAKFEEHRHDQSVFSLLVYEFERRGALGFKRIDIERTRRENSVIRGVRNKTPFRSVGRPRYVSKLLNKCYSVATKLLWDERRYRADLNESLRN